MLPVVLPRYELDTTRSSIELARVVLCGVVLFARAHATLQFRESRIQNSLSCVRFIIVCGVGCGWGPAVIHQFASCELRVASVRMETKVGLKRLKAGCNLEYYRRFYIPNSTFKNKRASKIAVRFTQHS
jgi:hypothetical protein